jgi:hypothetical protein
MKHNYVSTFSGKGQLEIIISCRVIEVRACTHIEGTCQEEKTIQYQESCSCLHSFKLPPPITNTVFSLLSVSVLHCTMHPSGLRLCPQHIQQAEPFPHIRGPEHLRSRVGSNFYISDRVVVSQPTVAPDADSKDADNSYVTGGNGLPIRCLGFLPASTQVRRPLQSSIQMLCPE